MTNPQTVPMKRQPIEGRPNTEEREALNGVLTNLFAFAVLIGAIRAAGATFPNVAWCKEMDLQKTHATIYAYSAVTRRNLTNMAFAHLSKLRYVTKACTRCEVPFAVKQFS